MVRKKEIKGFEGLYAVDTNGNVFSLVQNSSRRKRKLKPYVNTGGYLRVNLYDETGKIHKRYVHRLVAQTFIPNPGNKPDVNHKNADKDDNSVENLEWCDAKYNIAESRKLGLQQDKTVRATSILTGEVKEFPSIKEAAVKLAKRKWAFDYQRRKHGNHFYYGEWRIEVMQTHV